MTDEQTDAAPDATPEVDVTKYTNAKGRRRKGTWSKYDHYFDPDLAMWMTHHTDSDGADERYPQE